MRRHLQAHLRLLRRQHEEQQAEGRPQRLEAQPVSCRPRGGEGGIGIQGASPPPSSFTSSLRRIFFGKNKVMMVALGKEPSSEYKENLHQVGAEGSGGCWPGPPKAASGLGWPWNRMPPSWVHLVPLPARIVCCLIFPCTQMCKRGGE